ncbi:permease family-domain-containing protein [Kickxella alabastrina]|uniref:permease family-domain-containing protein n=1 Tax=Kickxella alabastrina TaxID=61397 RepID=UPI00221FDD2D|nr:permease family-domain-containing protein [Kickxella alabastrina]KAI7823124.1 permease family-domain-containing protein [Kickxella alabastrina]
MSWIDKLNSRVAQTLIGRWFRLEGSGAKIERPGSKFSVELRAGLTTFISMSYIISVNALIITDSGGTSYSSCLQDIKLDIITATCAISCLACIFMGVFANLPIALAPGMGLNAYFAYTVVGFHGSGKVSYRNALSAVFIEGIIFFVLSVIGLRQCFGIGIYLAFIGLQSSAGIGLITSNSSTLVELGGCPAEFRNKDNVCLSHHMEGGTMWLGAMGLLLMVTMLLYRIKGAILFGIVLIAAISWPRGTAVTAPGDNAFDFFKKVVTFHPIKRTLAEFHWDLTSGDVWIALVTFLYVDILDCTGTMFSMAKFGGYMDPKTQDFEGSSMAFLTDSVSIIIGSIFGSSPVTAFIESGAGISEGGRTGITTIVVGIMFFIAIFFAPIFASFPPWATGPALITVGSMMMTNYIGDSVPAFLTIILIPFGYSIGYGLIAGIGSFVFINSLVFLLHKASAGRITPPNFDERDDGGGFKSNVPRWILRLFGKKPESIRVCGGFDDIEVGTTRPDGDDRKLAADEFGSDDMKEFSEVR